MRAIEVCKPGAFIGGYWVTLIQSYVEPKGYSVVRDFVRDLHMALVKCCMTNRMLCILVNQGQAWN